MTNAYAVGMAQRGQVTLPKSLRDKYHLQEGQQLTVVDLGGSLLIVPQQSKIDAICNQLRDDLLESGATLSDMLAEIRSRRENGNEPR